MNGVDRERRRQPYRLEAFVGFLVVLRFSRWQFFQQLSSLQNFHPLLLLLVMSVSISLLIRHLTSQRRSSTSASFYQVEPAPSATPARFSGPVCDLLDSTVRICTNTLNSICLKNMYSSHQQMLSKCSFLLHLRSFTRKDN